MCKPQDYTHDQDPYGPTPDFGAEAEGARKLSEEEESEEEEFIPELEGIYKYSQELQGLMNSDLRISDPCDG